MSFDWALKTVLRDKANFDILEGFLSALLKQDVVVEELLESEGNRGEKGVKTNQVDLLVKLGGDERVVVEVQYTLEPDFLHRLLFGVSKVICDNLEVGAPYENVKKVISVSIVHFDVGFRQDDDYVYHGTTEFRGIHSHKLIVQEVALGREYGGTSWLELDRESRRTFPEYYIIPVKRFKDVIGDELDEWVYALKNSRVPPEFTAPRISKMRERLDVMAMKPEERRAYEKYLLRRASDEGVLRLKLQEGIALGKEQGRCEEKLEIARNLLDVQDDEMIAAKTSLAMEQIKNLRKEVNGRGER